MVKWYAVSALVGGGVGILLAGNMIGMVVIALAVPSGILAHILDKMDKE